MGFNLKKFARKNGITKKKVLKVGKAAAIAVGTSLAATVTGGASLAVTAAAMAALKAAKESKLAKLVQAAKLPGQPISADPGSFEIGPSAEGLAVQKRGLLGKSTYQFITYV